MSNIYIQEPPTHGKVLLETSVGDIDIELWSREAPKACRNFVQLCLEGYYDDTIFHRVVKGFIAQGGDPTGTGEGGESIYGKPFKDEFHTRLRFVRRGLVAMANAGRDDNGSQFFFTMEPATELQNKHTIFGKVTGNTVFNMLKLQDGLVDSEDRPLYPHRIKRTEVLNNPFKDIVPRTTKSRDSAGAAEERRKEDEMKAKDKGTKNFKLLSFGDEAEEDEEETNVVAKEYRGKSKSSHDLANDPRLSSVPAVLQLEEEERISGKRKSESQDEDTESKAKKRLEDVKNKLRGKASESKGAKEENQKSQEPEDEEDAGDNEHGENEKQKKMEEIRKEVRELKRELKGVKKPKAEEEKPEVDEDLDPAIEEYRNVMKKYDDKKTKFVKKEGTEQKTLEMLEKFKVQLSSAKDEQEEEPEDDESDAGWLNHKLEFESDERLAKDANIRDEDTFEIYDPRNPINQRRREASKVAMKEKAKKR